MTQEQKLKPGDTVMLNSSSPIMTIESLNQDKAFCKWFHDGTVREAHFYLTSLKKVDPSDYA